jgi:hypothetical protein
VADTHSIHLVSKLPPKQPLDPADIAAAVLETVRECSQALIDFENYQEALIAGMRAQLNHLELTAIRAIAQKVGRS